MEGRVLVAVLGVGVDALFEELGDELEAELLDGEVEAGAEEAAAGLRVGAGLEEEARGLELVLDEREGERRVVLRVELVDEDGVVLLERADDAELLVLDGAEDERALLRVDDVEVERAAGTSR